MTALLVCGRPLCSKAPPAWAREPEASASTGEDCRNECNAPVLPPTSRSPWDYAFGGTAPGPRVPPWEGGDRNLPAPGTTKEDNEDV